MTRLEARDLADKIIAQLKPYIIKGRVCGSYRRGKQELSDLDIVVLPKRQNITDLFGAVIGQEPVPGFINVINSWEKIKGDPTGKYTQRRLNGHKVEIAIAHPHNFGNLEIIRTGSAEFSHKLMKLALSRGLEQRDGFLYNGDRLIKCFDEKDYFAALGIPFIEPHLRDENAFKRLNFRS